LGKCRVGASHSHKMLGADKGNWWVVCDLLKWEGELVGDGVEIRFMVAHDKANGWWEGQSLIGHDELRDMGHLVPMRKGT
jgi:hypothetical protein